MSDRKGEECRFAVLLMLFAGAKNPGATNDRARETEMRCAAFRHVAS